MLKVTFIDAAGGRREVDAREGSSLMETAIENDVPSIVAYCGGMCSCGTCHCYVTGEWAARLPPPDGNELDTLKRVLDRTDASRLACQIKLRASVDGLTVELPARQRTP